MRVLILLVFVLRISTIQAHAQKGKFESKAIFLENIAWTSAKSILTPDVLVVIPLGAAAKEHGPHLPLSTDYLQAEAIAKLLALERKVIIAPLVNYGYYPAFLTYAGSTSVNFSTASEMVLEIIRSLARYGPKRFYIINIGVSTTPTLETAAQILADEGVLLYFSQYDRPNFVKIEQSLRTKAFGGHADELETSNILYLRSDLVDLNKAIDDSATKGKEGMILSPIEMDNAILNTSGVNGYPTLATKEKGRLYMEAFTREVIKEIDSITFCALPHVKDRTAENEKYEGEYTASGRKNLIIELKGSSLYFKPRGAKFFFPLPLNRNAEDYYTSLPLNILFEKDENGRVVKAWCQNRGESFWMTKITNP